MSSPADASRGAKDHPAAGPAAAGVELIATDLDGTLLRSDGTISDRTRRALAALEAAGVPVVFVTARPLRWLNDLWALVGAHGLAVVSNGAVLYDVANRQVIERTGIAPRAGLDLCASITSARPDASFAIECLDGIKRDPTFLDPHRIPPGSPVGPLEQIWDDVALKLLTRSRSDDLESFRLAVIAAVGDAATPTWSVEGLVEISAAGITKAAALAKIATRLGVDRANAVAFGDMPNDLTMLAWAGTSYAVANAHPDVQIAASHMTLSNDDDGVACILEDILHAKS